MKFGRIAILTSGSSWFLPYAKSMQKILIEQSYTVDLLKSHDDIVGGYDVLFILSYFRIIPKYFLVKNSYNLVVHESNLPEGKGWAPLFWQILEGKNNIPVVLFEALSEVDSGDIYCRGSIQLNGDELHDEIRQLQADETIRLCLEFMKNNKIEGKNQSGVESFYAKRTPEDSKLDIDKTIREQFQLLRIVNNCDYPAFFEINGVRYKISIEKYS